MAEEKALVGIIMGSESGMPNMEPCMKQLEGVRHSLRSEGCQRAPQAGRGCMNRASGAEERGMRVIMLLLPARLPHIGGGCRLYSAAGYCRAYENERLGRPRFASLWSKCPLALPRRMRRHQWREKRCAILAVQMLGTGCDECRKKIS